MRKIPNPTFFNLPSWMSDFLSDPFRKYLCITLICIGVFQYFFLSSSDQAQLEQQSDQKTVEFYFHPTCSHCNDQKSFNRYLESKYSELSIVSFDVTTPHGIQKLREGLERRKVQRTQLTVPVTIIGKNVIVGFVSPKTTGVTIEKAIQAYLVNNQTIFNKSDKEWLEKESVTLPLLGKIKLAEFSILSLAVILGVADGFNPCAMWVLVYLISIIISLDDRRKIWIIVGSFVLSSGVLYFLFMTAWLNVFLYIGYLRVLTTLVGLFALGAGILSVREFIITKGVMSCKIEDDGHRKKTMSTIDRIATAPISLGTISAIVVLAFTINSIEFVCSAALPAIFTHTLSMRDLLQWQYYGYILVYVFFFMLDDLIIFSLAALALDKSYGNKYSKYSKLVGGSVLVGLGMVMTFKPELLQ